MGLSLQNPLSTCSRRARRWDVILTFSISPLSASQNICGRTRSINLGDSNYRFSANNVEYYSHGKYAILLVATTSNARMNAVVGRRDPEGSNSPLTNRRSKEKS